MNVVCSRCSTRYEFDDALVSSRGTSVKCTNCGHKFRVHPPGGALRGLPDQWVIRKSAGESVHFDTLRDLQRALAEGSITVADEISRDGRTYRPIHSVPELESFFPKGTTRTGASTLVGMKAVARNSEIPRPPPATSRAPKPDAPDANAPDANASDYGDEEDVTTVYSAEQLDKLRPKATVATSQAAPLRANPITPIQKTPLGPPYQPKSDQTKAGPPAFARPPSTEARPSPGASLSKAPGGSPSAAKQSGTPPRSPVAGSPPPGFAGRPGMSAAKHPLPTSNVPLARSTPSVAGPPITGGPHSSLPPLPHQPRVGAGGRATPVSAPNRTSSSPGPLAGTPTISVTASPGQTHLQPSEIDTVRPPPDMDASGQPIVPDEDVPTRVGSLADLARRTALGIQPPPDIRAALEAASAAMDAAEQRRSSIPPGEPTPRGLHPIPERPGSVEARNDASGEIAKPPRVADATDDAKSEVAEPPGVADAKNEIAEPPRAEAPSPHQVAPATAAAAIDSRAPVAAPPPSETPEAGVPALPRRGGRRADDESGRLGMPPLGARETASAFDALDLDHSHPPTPPRSNLRWVFALLLLGGVVVAAITLGRGYLGSKEDAPVADARIDSLLEAGRQFYRQGDLASAEAEFAKARQVSSTHPGVITVGLLIEADRCDHAWLSLKMLAEDAPERAAKQDELAGCNGRLQHLAEQARGVTNPPAQLNALLLDSFRIRGELATARSRAAGLSEQATEPWAAYALAMLDVADESPGFATIIERLRLARGGELAPGRAHAALVFALAKSGDLEAARVELTNMDASSRKHPLLAPLKAFVDGLQSPEAAATASASIDVAGVTAPKAGGDETGSSEDLLEQARKARSSSDHQRAERLYQQALQLEPGNVAALTGLGDVAAARGNPVAALSHYHAALRVNPGYLPAVVGVADTNWANGDQTEAAKYYKRIGPGNAYSDRARKRLAQLEGASPSPPPAERPSTPSEPVATAEEPEEAPESEPEATESEPQTPESEPEAEPEPIPPSEPAPPEVDNTPAPPGPPPGPAPRNSP